MFIQIHMLQSLPPGNLNRDETGQPKQCLFGNTTRSRISSQCLKRNIRMAPEFKEHFSETECAIRTLLFPQMVVDSLTNKMQIEETEKEQIGKAIAAKFRSEKKEDAEETTKKKKSSEESGPLQTPQLVFFPPGFIEDVAAEICRFKKEERDAYTVWLCGNDKEKKKFKKAISQFESAITNQSKVKTVDIALFGRMTTSDLVVNVEAACQVAHAIGTHEVIIESDYFTAIDDKKRDYADSQSAESGAAFLGTGDTQTFFNSSVFYKYYNIDLSALHNSLGCSDADLAKIASLFTHVAAVATPTGKQNAFAAHGLPEFILVEISRKKRPLSYANAFLQAVEGENLMTASADALIAYMDDVVNAYAPKDMQRILMAVGSAKSAKKKMQAEQNPETIYDLEHAIKETLTNGRKGEGHGK